MGSYDKREDSLKKREETLDKKTKELDELKAYFESVKEKMESKTDDTGLTKVLGQLSDSISASPNQKKKRPPVYVLEPYTETYHRVTFFERTDENQTAGVELGVNGNQLHIKRGVPVIIPKSFLLMLENARYPIFEQLPGKTRKVKKIIQHYAYNVHEGGECSREDYENMLREGNAIQAEALRTQIASEGVEA